MPDCPNGACALHPHGLLLRRAAVAADCAAGVLISAEPIEVHCADDVAVIDRFSVWRAGAAVVWITADGARVATDRDHRANRPWVLGPPLAGRVPPNTRPAKIEALPPEVSAPAGDRQEGAGGVGRLVGQQEQDRFGDLVGGAHAPHRH